MNIDDSNRVNARLGIYGGRGIGMPLDGIDWFDRLQEPEVEPGDDPLARFVLARIIELELEPRGEIKPLYDEPGGAMAHRYAKHVRNDCIVFRQILAAYLEAGRQLDAAEDDYAHNYWGDRQDGLRTAVHAIAARWSDHRDFRSDWQVG